ncbi:MAG: NAD-dependent epimerase/dehydratase family protein [Elusimicrobiota bacterium]|nr:NAD-dependent epimerase/dehydratase family protein [Elusimicrobiota bacterium]
MKSFKVLVSGASGFVGRSLAEYLPGRGYEVHSFTHRTLDLLDEAAVAEKLGSLNPDVVLHCAAAGGSRKTGYDAGSTDVVSKNLRMFFNLARSLKPGMRMLTMGSGAEYDKRHSLPKIPEDRFDSHVPADDYGYAKYVISKYIEKTDNITCLRIFGLYGKYEDYSYKFISNAIVKNLLGLPIVINQNVKFDYLWIDDFCALVGRFLEKEPASRHYNVTPSESADLLSLADAVNSAAKSKSEVKVLSPGLNAEYTGSNLRLLGELGGFNFTSYESGVKQLYAYYAARLGELDLETVRKDPFIKLCKTSGGRAADI